MNESITQEFELVQPGKNYRVVYDTDSKVRNRIIEIWYDNLPLDVATLRMKHPELYFNISNAMKNNSESYWKGREVMA